MATRSISPSYPIYTEKDGTPLEDGYVYIGAINQNPEEVPISVYWDQSLTIQAEQPIRTLGGYPARDGTPARLYAASDYSTTVRSKNLAFVYSSPISTDLLPVTVVNGTSERWNYTAGTPKGDYDGSLTTFPVSYDVGFLDFSQNGLDLEGDGVDFTATNGTSVTLTTAATAGDSIKLVAYGVFEVANHYTIAQSDAITGLLTSLSTSDKTSLVAAINELVNGITGEVKLLSHTTVPSGYYECDGTAKSRTTDSALFAAIGTTYGAGDGSTTFNIPDLRGEFIRGWDNGRGIDPGRSMASTQADAFEAHTHQLDWGNYNIPSSGGTIDKAAGSTNADRGEITLGNTGGTETRPRNIAMMYCIKR